jgi:hypothetical protein
MSTIGTVFAISFCLSRDSWGNGQLVASVFLHSFLPVLFCLVWTHQWEILLIVYFITYYAAGICSWLWDLRLCCHCLWWFLPFPVRYLWALPVTPDYILSLLSTCPIPNDYIGIHFGCVQPLLVFLFLWFFFSWVWILCFLVCSTCFYLRPVNVSVDINVFFRPVCCILVGYYVISSILLPYLPSVCVRLILGAMGTTESHWFLVHWFTQQSQRMGMYVHSFGTRYNLQFLSSSKTCLKFLLCILQDLHVF